MRLTRLVAVILLTLVLLVAVAEAKPPAKVYGVSLRVEAIENVPTAPLFFYAEWKLRHGPPDKIQIRLMVDGVVIHDDLFWGPKASIPYRTYERYGMVQGAVVTVAVRAITGKKVQKWQTASVVVPVRW